MELKWCAGRAAGAFKYAINRSIVPSRCSLKLQCFLALDEVKIAFLLFLNRADLLNKAESAFVACISRFTGILLKERDLFLKSQFGLDW